VPYCNEAGLPPWYQGGAYLMTLPSAVHVRHLFSPHSMPPWGRCQLSDHDRLLIIYDQQAILNPLATLEVPSIPETGEVWRGHRWWRLAFGLHSVCALLFQKGASLVYAVYIRTSLFQRISHIPWAAPQLELSCPVGNATARVNGAYLDYLRCHITVMIP
jgi:hypothetical protein